jgi:acetyl-CoA C-acetyltransferase
MNTRSNLDGRPVFVVDGCRTPFLKAEGKPGPFRASDLAMAAARPLMMRQPFSPQALDEVILGCVSSGPDESNIARVVALRLGCGDQVPAWTVQRNCASGMQALDNAAQDIASGRSHLVLAGGTESMSHFPVLLNLRMVAWLGAWAKARSLVDKARLIGRLRPNYLQPVIAILRGLMDPVVGLSMGQTAENLAWRFDISRQDMDAYALQSHQRLDHARNQGWMDEIEPLFDAKGEVYEHDEGLRASTSMEKLGSLRPVFDRPTGKVTAGNSAQVTDGAAWLILASEEAVKRYDLQVLGRIADSQWAALDPAQMGLGPVHAMAPLLRRQQLGTTDVDYWEINEAFAAQVLACQRAWSDQDYCKQQLELDQAQEPIAPDRLNVDGGGISLGHPVGASGARIVLHLTKVLARNGSRRGMASLCVGGGQGGAMLIECDQ